MFDREVQQNDEDIRLFERIYERAAGDTGAIPWSHRTPHPLLVEWLDQSDAPVSGRALVIACGLGDDAEELARRGWPVAAFDASPTAIAWAQRRFPRSRVPYRVADLFALPADWHGAFALVVENRTIQSLPPDRHAAAIAAIAGTVAPGGALIAIAHGRDEAEPPRDRPWPLSRRELDTFQEFGLTADGFTDDYARRGVRLFRGVYRRPR